MRDRPNTYDRYYIDCRLVVPVLVNLTETYDDNSYSHLFIEHLAYKITKPRTFATSNWKLYF